MRRLIVGAGTLPDITLTRDHLGAIVRLGDKLLVNTGRHSPTGLEWGYAGSGPSDLAHSILSLFIPPTEVERLYFKYKQDVISKLHQRGGIIRARDVRDWILDQWHGEQGAK